MAQESVTCPRCERHLELPEEHLGKEVQCPQCSAVFVAGAARRVPTPRAPVHEPPVVNVPLLEAAPIGDDRPLAIDAGTRSPTRVPAAVKAPAPRRNKRGIALLAVLVAVFASIVCWQIDGYGRVQRAFFGAHNAPLKQKAAPFAAGKANPLDLFLPPAVNDQAPKAQMDVFFDRLTRTLREADRESISGFFDGTSIVDEMFDSKRLPENRRPEREKLIQAINRRLGVDIQEDFAGGSQVVRQVKKLNDRDLAVITWWRGEQGRNARLRWWISKRGGVWKIVDAENLERGCRISIVAAAGATVGDFPGKQDILKLYRQARGQIVAKEELRNVRLDHLPRSMKGSYHLMHAITLAQESRHEDCLAACDRGVDAHPDMPMAELLRAISYRGLKKFEQALVHARKSHELMGDDVIVLEENALALHELARFDEAAVYYRKTLDAEPERVTCFHGLLRCIRLGDCRDIGARFAKVPRPDEQFPICAQIAWSRFDAQALEQLAVQMQKVRPQSADAALYLALAQADQSRLGPAIASFKQALRLQHLPERQRDYYRQFAEAVVFRDLTTSAYQELPDRSRAFEALSTALRNHGRVDDWHDLIALHERNQPDDPLMQLQKADVLVEAEKFAAADKLYRAAFTKTNDANLRQLHRVNATLARYRSGDFIGAYRDSPLRAAAFGQVANLIWDDKRAPDLQKLVDLRREDEGADAQLARQEWRIKILLGRFEEAGKIALESWNATDPQDRRRRNDDFVFDMIDAHRFVEGYRHAPDRTAAFQVVVAEVRGLRRDGDLRTILDEQRKQAPDDPLSDVIEADLARAQGDWKKAWAGFRTAWPRLDANLRVRWEYLYLFSAYKAGQPILGYQATTAKVDAFRTLARIALQEKDQATFERLLEAHRSRGGAEPEFNTYLARSYVLQGKFDAAAALMDKAWAAAGALDRSQWTASFLDDLTAFDRGVDAYRVLPDKRLAFQNLTWRLRSKKQLAELERLVDEHAKHHPDDPRLLLERGEVHLLRNDAAQADKAFQIATERVAQIDATLARNGLLRARIRLGRTVATYVESGANFAAFNEIAVQCVVEKNADQLQALVAEHRKTRPTARYLLAWEVEAAWLKKDHAATAAMIRAHRELLSPGAHFRWKCEGYLVRSLVHTKNFKEAIQEAEAMNQRKYGPELLLVLAVAATGDVPRTIAYLDKSPSQHYLIESCYVDEDLGPLLRSDAFAAFRKRFPEPPKMNVPQDFD